MQTHIIHTSNLSADQNASLYWQQLVSRKAEFHDRMGWDIPCMGAPSVAPDADEGLAEADIYDRLDTYYVIASDGDGHLKGNARLIRTTAAFAAGTTEWSYMVRDATRGLLPGMPENLSHYTPVSSDVWEMSRFQAEDAKTTIALFRAAAQFLKSQGATGTVAFSRSGFVKLLTRIGYPSEQVGPDVYYDGKPYTAIKSEIP
ncbi:acyl-homoserine-lactone synthase [Thalassobius sp. I31.1]|uniref:acyl-homoserine-lactone synthase n=1 Tax=Thalassobius sp. I31.1 TaxID=2109912 RepID=UPI000D19F012|nr:acyl-homoserine-lactone synthase [Thalassobius sp. I31.1]